MPISSSFNPATVRRFRLLKAYGVTLRILLSIGFFSLLGRFMGPEWTSRKLPDRYRINARRLKRAILSLKGLFIKVGQLISILTNFLPEEFRQELEELQDKIPSRPLDEITDRILQEFEKPPEELFAVFDPEALASASLAQVHRARLFDDRQVAVKIQYVDIQEIARLDLQTIHRILKLVGWVLRVRGLETNFQQIREMILEELDFSQEAEHIETIAANFSGDSLVSFPQVVHDRSTQRILTTEFIDGAKVTDLETLAGYGVDRTTLAERVLRAYCQMIFVDGLYHADPHPGNILIRPDGGIAFVDFGAVAQLSPEMKEGIPQFLEGVLQRNTEQISRALRRMGFIAHKGDELQIERIINYFYDRFLEDITLDSWSLKDIQFDAQMKLEMMADMRRMNISLRELTSTFQVPKDWVQLERTLLLLLGICTHLDREMNPMRIIRPYLEEFVLGKDRDWKTLVSSVVKNMALSAFTIPEDVKRFLHKANRGELEVRVPGLWENARLLYALGHQLLYGMLAAVMGGFSYLAHIRGEETLFQTLLGGSGFFLICLGGSLLSARRLQKRHRNHQ